jgi:hypothetical protein
MVESIINCSRSASLSGAAKRARAPALLQRENRVYVVCQPPNSSGKSRQGLPGSNCSIRSHWSSRITLRTTPIFPQRSGCKHISSNVNRPYVNYPMWKSRLVQVGQCGGRAWTSF